MTDLDLTLDLGFEYEEPASAGQARALRTAHRHIARRAKSEEVLHEILPPVIAPGESWHVLSAGDVDALSYLAHLLRETPMDHVILSTWCMARADVEQLLEWVDAAKIRCLDAYVGEIFPGQYADADELLRPLVRRTGGRVAVFRNHSKLFLARAGARAWVVESSANVNTNPRAENTTITADWELYQHYKAYLDGIRSFDRDFDDWTPQD